MEYDDLDSVVVAPLPVPVDETFECAICDNEMEEAYYEAEKDDEEYVICLRCIQDNKMKR